mgnify:CR=1 FL=1
MSKEQFTMWFQNIDDRNDKTKLLIKVETKSISGRKELRKYAKQYDFNADEVIKEGEIEILDVDDEIIGGVFREES